MKLSSFYSLTLSRRQKGAVNDSSALKVNSNERKKKMKWGIMPEKSERPEGRGRERVREAALDNLSHTNLTEEIFYRQ